jgi:Zn-finger nucleic acid-binding protein
MSLDCPRCFGVKLEEVEVDEVIIDRCPRCAGIWFDNAEIGEIIGRGSGPRKIDTMVPAPKFTDSDLKCPHCSDVQLRKLSFGAEGGRSYVIYRCISCVGTWLDRGELREAEDPRLAAVLKDYFSKAP